MVVTTLLMFLYQRVAVGARTECENPNLSQVKLAHLNVFTADEAWVSQREGIFDGFLYQWPFREGNIPSEYGLIWYCTSILGLEFPFDYTMVYHVMICYAYIDCFQWYNQ